MMYEVYVRTNGSVFYTDFCYNWLSILGEITVNGSNLDGFSAFVEADRSIQLCSPYTWDAAELSITPQGIIAFQTGNPFSQEDPENIGQCIPLDNSGSALLFSVVVHAPLGATVSWKNPGLGINPYVWAFAKNTKYGANCSGELGISYGGAPNPTVVMPSPSVCSNAKFSFDVPANMQTFPGNFLDAVQVPIILSGLPQGTIIEEIEALVEVKTTNYMEYGNIQSDIFYCPALYDPSCEISVLDYTSGNFRYKKIHALATNVTVNGNENIFNVHLLGPLNESISDCAEVIVRFVRIKIAGQCCTVSPAATQSVQVCYQGSPPCNDFDLTVSEVPAAQGDCKVRYKVDVSWSYNVPSFNFENLDFILRFPSDLPFSVIENNTLCPSCISVTALNNNKLFEVKCDLDNALVNKNSSFDIVFDGAEGCVLGHLFLQSTLKVLSQSVCVPELHPPYTLGGYSRCSARLAGSVNYMLSNICGDINVEAVASDASAPCHFEASLPNGTSAYSFCVCRDKFPYTVTCSRDGNLNPAWLNGVTTYDLVLISKHILGIEPLDNVFKQYASDANCSGSVTTLDIVHLRELILGIIQVLPNNTPSYKFFDAVPPAQPNMQSICLDQVNTIVPSASSNVNFYIVKTGDVTWQLPTGPTYCLMGELDDRERQVISFQMEGKLIGNGNRVRIPLVFDGDASFSAMQFELKFDPSRMRFFDISMGDIAQFSEDDFGFVNVEDGLIRFAWFSESGEELQVERGKILCYLEFDALQPFSSDALDFNDDKASFYSTAYDAAGRESGVYHIELLTSAQSVSIPVENHNHLIYWRAYWLPKYALHLNY